MLNLWGKVEFIAFKRSMKDGGALLYKTAGVTLLLDWLLVMCNCWGNMFIALKRTVEHREGGQTRADFLALDFPQVWRVYAIIWRD